jgi:hypothetical protein
VDECKPLVDGPAGDEASEASEASKAEQLALELCSKLSGGAPKAGVSMSVERWQGLAIIHRPVIGCRRLPQETRVQSVPHSVSAHCLLILSPHTVSAYCVRIQSPRNVSLYVLDDVASNIRRALRGGTFP